MDTLDLMETKYHLMESSLSESRAVLAHDACNLAMAFIGQVNGRIRKVWAISAGDIMNIVNDSDYKKYENS